MSVQADLELAIDDALSSVDQLGSALQATTDEFTTGLQGALDALTAAPVVDVEADVSGAQTSLDDLLANIEGAAPEVTPEVDSSGITEAADEAERLSSDLDDVASSAVDAGGSTGDAGGQAASAAGSFAGLSAATRLAKGDAGGLTSTLEGVGGGAAKAAGGAAAVAAAIGVFFVAGEKSVAATERLNVVFGGMSDQVQRINIGGLNGDMSELATRAGSSGAQLRQAAAGLGQLALASGAGKREAADFTQQISALSLRAVALNPNLGEAGDVADRMGAALARGGRFAAKLGIDLTSTEINARALADTGKTTAADLSIYEKSAAGAALATERLGNKLGSDFQRGAEQSAVAMKRLQAEIGVAIATAGKPLVAPIIQIFEALLPLVTSVSTVLGGTFASAISVVAPALVAIGEVVSVVARGFSIMLDAIPDPVILVALGAAAIVAAGGIFAVTDAIIATTVAMATNPFTLALVGLAAIAAAVGIFAGDAEDASAKAKKLADNIDKVDAKQAAHAFREMHEAAQQFNSDADAFDQISDGLKKVGENSPAAAQKVVTGLRDMGAASGFTTSEIDRLQKVVDASAHSFQSSATNASQARDANDQLADSATGLTAAQQAAKDSADALASSLITGSSAVPTLGGVFTAFGSAVASAFGDTATPSVQGFVDNLTSTAGGIATWNATVTDLLRRGLFGLAALVQSQGPVIGGGLATEINAATPATAAAWNAQIEAGTTALATGKARTDRLAQDTATGLVTGLAGAAPGAAAAGAAASAGLQTGVSPMPGIATNAASAAVGGVSGLGNPAYNAGALVGGQFGEGMAGGMASRAGIVAGAARSLVDTALAAGRARAEAASPSKLFARQLGLPIAQGVAVGVDQGANLAAQAMAALVVGASQVGALQRAAVPAVGVGTSAGSPLAASSTSTQPAGRAAPVIGTQNFYGMDPTAAATATTREARFLDRFSGT